MGSKNEAEIIGSFHILKFIFIEHFLKHEDTPKSFIPIIGSGKLIIYGERAMLSAEKWKAYFC